MLWEFVPLSQEIGEKDWGQLKRGHVAALRAFAFPDCEHCANMLV